MADTVRRTFRSLYDIGALLTYVTQAWRKVGSPTFLFLSSRLAVAA